MSSTEQPPAVTLGSPALQADEGGDDAGKNSKEALVGEKVSEDQKAELRAETASKWKPDEEDISEAKRLGIEGAAGWRDGGWMDIQTPIRDLRFFGAGIHLQFGFNMGFLRLMWFCAVLSIPFVVFCLLGRNMTNGSHVPVASQGTAFEYFAWTSVPNLGDEGSVDGVSDSRTVPWIGGNVFAKDVGFAMSMIDALTILTVFIVALWYELRVIPQASEEHRLTESFTVYVDSVPARLPGDDHYLYEEKLREHFDRVLHAHLHPEGKKGSVVAGLQVIRRKDTGMEHYLKERWCGKPWCCVKSSPYDNKGRHIGKVVEEPETKELKVKWRPTERGDDNKWIPLPLEELRPAELFEHKLKKRIEFERSRENFVEEEDMVHTVSLVRDYAGTLSALRAGAAEREVQRAKAEAAMEAEPDKMADIQKQLDEMDEQEASLRKENLEKAKQEMEEKKTKRMNMSWNIPTEERDVLGAYVVFSRRRNRNFIFQEYRFSRTFMRYFQRADLQFYGEKIRVKEATDPSEVYWENMDVTLFQQAWRAVAVVLIAAVIIILSVALFSAAKQAAEVAKDMADSSCNETLVYVDTCLADTDCECINAGLWGVIQDSPKGVKACCNVESGDQAAWLDQQVTAQSLQLGSSIAPAALNFVISMVIQILAHFLKKKTLTATNISITIMTVFLQLINMVVALILVQSNFGRSYYDWLESWLGSDDVMYFPVGAGRYQELDPGWYVDVGAVVVFSLCISMVTVPAAMPASYVIQWAMQLVFKTSQESLDHLQELFKLPEYQLAQLTAQDIVMIVACLSFSAGFPILWAVLALYLTLSFFVKKWVFLRASREPPHFSNHLAKLTVIYIQIAALIHCFFAVRVFSATESVPSDMLETFYGDLGYNTTYSTNLLAMADETWVVSDFISRMEYVNTHPQWFVIFVVVVVGVIRLVFFILGQAAQAVLILLARLVSHKAGSHRGGMGAQIYMKMEQNGCGRCMIATYQRLKAFFFWVGTCIADFLPNLQLESLMSGPFQGEPLEYFKSKKIPYSYDMGKNNSDLNCVATGKTSRATRTDALQSAVSAVEKVPHE